MVHAEPLPRIFGLTPAVIDRLRQVVRQTARLPEADIDECVSHALSQAVRHNPPVRDLFAWMVVCGRNRAKDIAKNVQAQKTEPLHDDGEYPTRANQLAVDASIDLRAALAQLRPDVRRVWWLFEHVGLTHDEIAERLGITTGASKMRLFRARSALSSYLG